MRKPDSYDLIAGIIIAVFLLIAFTAMTHKGITNDELAHIVSGYSYIKTGDYRMNVEHPPLIKLLSGLALLPLHPRLPIDHPSWAARNEWVFGDRFFYAANHNADHILFWARTPMVFLGALLIFFVYQWARQLFGPIAGILSAFLTAMDPLVIAMSTVVHTDIGITLFGFLSVYTFWGFCKHRTRKNLAWSALCLGLALASKFTGLYFIPILGLLALVTARHDAKDQGLSSLATKQAKQLYLLLGAIILIAAVIFVAFYQFTQLRYFMMGMVDVSLHSTIGHRSFLHGTFSETGFWYYFPVAFLIKTPLPSIALLIVSCLFYWKTRSEDQRNEWFNQWFLIIPTAIYLLLFMVNRINIGLRHILPIYPFLFVYASRTTRLKSRIMPAILAVLMIWLAWNTYSIYPHYLSSFNGLIGGPDHGHEWLIDSNIDWGQDLKGLAQWLHERKDPLVKMAYFGLDDRDYRNITWDELKCGPQPGLIAISVNRLVGFDLNDSACSAWLRGHKPIAKIGYSIFIYNISEESIALERKDYCQEKCKEKCHAEKQIYISSEFDAKCHCRCSGTGRSPAEQKAETSQMSPEKEHIKTQINSSTTKANANTSKDHPS